MSITLAPAQEAAIEKIRQWHARAKVDAAPQIFRLFGYAGTGKTTIAKQVKTFANKVQFGAFTGKAALVLNNKGCEGARTIHSMIYRASDRSKVERDNLKAYLESIKEDPAKAEEVKAVEKQIIDLNLQLQQPGFSLNPNAFIRKWDDDCECYVSLTPPDLIVIDECSMVDKRLGQDLESFRIPILVLGDPAQLPPVAGGGYFTEAKPDVLLTEIHRQAGDNPIVDIATQIRTGRLPPLGQYGNSRIVEKRTLSQDEWLSADQILCGRNNTRHGINARVRQLRGHLGLLPEVGERLVCLRNNHQLGLLNGSMWRPTEVTDMPTENFFTMTIESLDDPEREPVKTVVHKKPFLGQEFEDMYERREADEFDFGYCITTHKAQGSEWSHVIYIDEWPSRNGDERRRHQYTGVTRASERITVVKWG